MTVSVCASVSVCVCKYIYMFEVCCVNVWQTMGKFSFADRQPGMGVGEDRGRKTRRGLGGKKIPEIVAEIPTL